MIIKLRNLNRRLRRCEYADSLNNSNLIAMRAFRGMTLIDGRLAIRRNHQIQKAMQICWLKNSLSDARVDALLEATNLVQVLDPVNKKGPAFNQEAINEGLALYNSFTLKSLKAEGVSPAARRLLRTVLRHPEDLDSKYFRRVNRRLETKLLALAAIAADTNKSFASPKTAHSNAEISSRATRGLMKIDMNHDLWSWFTLSVGLPLYETDDAGRVIRLIGPQFEGVANMQPEFNYALAQVRKRLGTSAVIHLSDACPKCLTSEFSIDQVIGHTLNISYDFAWLLERQTNFLWSDRPQDLVGPHLKRLPSLAEDGTSVRFDLILGRD